MVAMGRSPARYDTADLDRLNAQALHAMDYATAQPRLQALDADLGEAFWGAVRPNLQKFGDVVEMAKIIQGPIQPVIEDAGFIDAAALERLAEPVLKSGYGRYLLDATRERA